LHELKCSRKIVVLRALFMNIFFASVRLSVALLYSFKYRNVLLESEGINGSYRGNPIVYTSAIAALNLTLVFKNIRVYMTIEKHLKRESLSL